MKNFIVATTIVVIAGISMFSYALPMLNDALTTYTVEGECLANLIAKGIERADIAVENGKCWIK